MKKLKLPLLLFVAGLIITACGSGKSGSQNSAKALKKLDSYAFLPNKDTIMNRDYDNDRIHEVIVETINSNMRDEGYYLDTLQPEVLIYVHTMFDAKADVNANPVYTDYSYYRPGHYIGPYYKPYVYENYFTIQRLSGENIEQEPYRERSIVIDFINRKNNKIIWRATSSEEIETRKIEREVRNYIDDIFRKFP